MGSRRTLARFLETIDDFDEPRIDLEQYLTPPELAAHLCQVADLQDDLSGETVVDLGTGTGMLAIGASIAEPERVIGVDVDSAAVSVAANNARVLQGRTRPEWVIGDVTRLPLSITDATVVSNPPFGAQDGRRHADRHFLEVARRIGSVSYTIHNQGSEGFVEAYADDNGGRVTHAFAASFPVDHRFEFHTADREVLDVELFRIEWSDEISSDDRPES